MSKELTPLEALRRIRDYDNLPSRNPVLYLLEQENLPTYYKVIETALKRLKEIDEWKSTYQIPDDEVLRRYIHNGWFFEIKGEKQLKALEIIKERANLNITELSYDDEEYDLLKEVLL